MCISQKVNFIDVRRGNFLCLYLLNLYKYASYFMPVVNVDLYVYSISGKSSIRSPRTFEIMS